MSDQGKKTGIIYCRVSSKDQVEGTSLESQERMCREYALRNDIEIVHEPFIDKGESAKTADRPEFIKAITFCSDKKKPVNYFIVYKVDRFARNQDDHVSVRATLRKFGTELRSVTEPVNESSLGRLMEGVLSSFAEFDNNVRTERTRIGMMEKVKQGIWQWQAPLGYYRAHKGANITPEPHNTGYIRLIFEEYAKGTHGYDSLAEFMAERGFRTRGGKKVYGQLIEKIIKNPVYCGIIDAFGLRIKGTGTFTEIVGEDLFNQCQEGYRKKSKFEKRVASNPEFPLRRAVCAVCDKSITGSFSKGRKGKKYPYYHHHTKGCPNARSIPRQTFEQLFVEYLHEINPTSKYEKAFRAIMMDVWQSNYKRFDEQKRQVNKELEKLEGERQKVFDLHRSGSYSDDEFLEQKRLINGKIREKRTLLTESHIKEFDMEESLNYCFMLNREAAKTWLRLKEYDYKLRFQKNIFPGKITFDGKKFGTTKLASIYQLNKDSDGGTSNLVAPRGIEPLFTP